MAKKTQTKQEKHSLQEVERDIKKATAWLEALIKKKAELLAEEQGPVELEKLRSENVSLYSENNKLKNIIRNELEL